MNPVSAERLVSPVSQALDLDVYIETQRRRIDAALEALLPAELEQHRSGVIYRAMRYSLHAGGKRLRPLLALAAAEVCGGDSEAILPSAAALEMIHTYSLIHDDLPALDNDSLRRGKPTNHVVFGEAIAILAGDGLLTAGLQALARYPERRGAESGRPEAPSWESRKLDALGVVAGAIDASGMIGGQVADLEATGAGRGSGGAGDVEFIHARKTAGLIRAAVLLGGILAGAGETARRALGIYGDRLGLLFQIVDDILDVTGNAATLGKSAGKDAACAKLTYPAVFGLDGARRHRDELLDETLAAAGGIEGEPHLLAAIARYVASRDH